MKALSEKKPLDEVLLANPAVAMCISRKEMGDLLSPDRYIGTAVKQVERLHGKLRGSIWRGEGGVLLRDGGK